MLPQAPQVPVARLGDPATSAMFAAAVLAGHQPEVGHQRGRRGEAPHVVQLRGQAQRRDRVDAAEAPQMGHRRLVRLLSSGLGQSFVQGRDPRLLLLDRQQVVLEHDPVGGSGELQAVQPGVMTLGPLVAVVEDQ